MVLEVSSEQLLFLKEELHKRFLNKEQCAYQFHFIISLLIDGKWKDCSMFVDEWPNFNVVVARPLPEEKLKVSFVRAWHFIYSRDNIVLEEVLSTPGFLNWNIGPRFCYLSVAFKDTVIAVCKKFGGTLETMCDTSEFHYCKDSDSIKNDIPAGFSLHSMDTSMVKMAASEWKFSNQERFGVEEYISHLVTTLPSSCLKNEKGDVVCYMLTYFFGVIGMLYVKPEHRRCGYGKIVSLDLMKKVQKLGFIPAVTIEPDNEASLHLYCKLNFEKVEENLWAVFSKKTI